MRMRVRFAKVGKVRWTSQRDVARMWERAFRKVGLPLAYTQGFSPRPKLSFGLALPTGAESMAEYLDFELAPTVPPEPSSPGACPPGACPPGASELADAGAALSAALPKGVEVVGLAPVDDREGSLQAEVTSCRWELEVQGAAKNDLAQRVDTVMTGCSLIVTRQRKGRATDDDLRPAIESLTVSGDPGQPVRLDTVLATQPRGIRPSELLAGIGSHLELTRMVRTHQWIERDGARWEPLPLDATGAKHALERAS